MPFKKPAIVVNEKQGTAPVEGLSLAVPEAEVASNDYGFAKEKLQQPHQQEQLQKKQRRCWSPELHKIFVDALHQLGGAQSTNISFLLPFLFVKLMDYLYLILLLNSLYTPNF